MTAKDVIEIGNDGAAAATLSGRDLKDAANALKDGAVHRSDRALHLKHAPTTLKRCAAAAKDRGDTPKVQRLLGTLRDDASKVLYPHAVLID